MRVINLRYWSALCVAVIAACGAGGGRRVPDATTDGGGDASALDGEDAQNVAALAEDELLFAAADGHPESCGGTGPDYNIEVGSILGGARRALPVAVNSADDEIWPRISPDRTRFVFYRTPLGETGETCRYDVEELWIANVDGTGVRKVFSTEDKEAVAEAHGWPLEFALQGHADWSPDGTHVVMFLGHVFPVFGLDVPVETQLFILNVDTGDLRQLTNRRDAESGKGTNADPSFSRDGEHVIFVGCPDAQPADCPTTHILAVPWDATMATTTTTIYTLASSNDVYVSPDGTELAWMEPPLYPIKVAPFRLSSPLEADEVTVLEASGGYGSWAADGSFIFNRGYSIWRNVRSGDPAVDISPADPATHTFSYPSP